MFFTRTYGGAMKRIHRNFLLALIILNLLTYSTVLFIVHDRDIHNEPLLPTFDNVANTEVLATWVPSDPSYANGSNDAEQTDAMVDTRHSNVVVNATADNNVAARINPATVPNQVILTFTPDASLKEREQFLQTIGATLVQQIDNLNTVVVQLESLDMSEVDNSPLLVATEPDYYAVAQSSGNPNDPLLTSQWSLPLIGVNGGWEQFTDATPSITVAVIDSGVCSTHDDLQGRILSGVTFISDETDVEDEYGHGCAITGVIAANIDNAIAIAGIAPNAQIMPLRVLDENGVGTYSSVASAIVYATDHGAQFINLSLGGSSPSNLLESAVNYATSHHVTIIAAAGNQSSSNILYPAAYSDVIAVGALDRDLNISSFSNFGNHVDIYAPGRDIVTLGLNNTTTTMSGTSIATALATGVAVLEKAYGRTLTLGGMLAFNPSEMFEVEEPEPTFTTDIAPEVNQAITDYGSARVMIAINLPINAQDNTARAQAIAIAQSEILAQLAPEEFGLTYQFINTPALSGTLNADGLAKLRASGLISHIYLDEPTEAASIRSAVSINADDVQTGAVNGLPLTGTGVNVAVLDSGINMNNPAVADDVVVQKCFSSTSGCPGGTTEADIAPDSLNHGTNVSAVITAPDGVAPDAGIVAIRVLDEYGRGFSSDWVAALDWIYSQVTANQLSVDVVNMSLGSLKLYKANPLGNASNCDSFYPTEAQAIQRMTDLGIIVVSATGNQGSIDSINAPACLSNVIAVGAIYDADLGAEPDTGTYYSQLRGNWPNCADTPTAPNQVTCFSNSSNWVDVLAPGAQIIVGNTGGSGTSQAAPHVAGVAALMVQADNLGETPFAVSPSRVITLLRNNGVVVVDPRNGLTFRSLDALAVMNQLINPVGFTSCAEVIGTTESQCSTLVNFFDTTGGPNWNDKTGWKQTNTPCTWYGVTCDGAGNVIELELVRNNLAGKFPDLSGLTELTRLYLEQDTSGLAGPIPDSIGSLTNLRELTLVSSGYLAQSQLPSAIGNLTNLRILRLNFLGVNGSIPASFSNLTNLETLDLSGNLFSQLTDIFAPLVNLNYLNLRNTNLNSIPASLSSLPLIEVNLGDNELTGSIPADLLQIPTLESLNLSQNQLTGTIPFPATTQDNLLNLNLSWNTLSGSISSNVGNLINLNNLDLSYNLLTGSLPDELNYLVALQFLDLSFNHLSGIIRIGGLTSLVSADFTYNAFSEIRETPLLVDVISYIRVSYGVKITVSGIMNKPVQWTEFAPSDVVLSSGPVDGQITITSPLFSYEIKVEYKRTSEPAFTLYASVGEVSPSSPYSISGLIPGANYEVKLTSLTVIYNPTPLPNILYMYEGQSTSITATAGGTFVPVVSVCDSVSTISSEECFALEALYDATDGANWSSNSNWKTDPDPCTWYGVDCLGGGHVYQLDLSYNGLNGYLPGELAQLGSLTVLNLRANTIGGAIPDIFAWLPNLSDLNLEDCDFTDSIPTSIGLARQLDIINLRYNHLTGPIPDSLFALPNLTNLFLNGNQLSGDISGIGSLSNIQNLNLSNNELQGIIPSEIGNLTTLISLNLGGNQFSGSIPDSIGNLINLTDMNLADNQLIDSIPDSIGNLTALNNLVLSSNKLSGPIPDSITLLPSLFDLDISSNQLSGSIPINIGNMTSLININLSRNQLSGAIPDSITNLTYLGSLWLSDNQFSGDFPNNIDNLIYLGGLALGGSPLNLPASIGNLPSLSYLSLKDMQLTEVPDWVQNATGLTTLDLSGNELTTLPASLSSLSNLQYLYLNDNQFTQIPPVLAVMGGQLNTLYLERNNITGTLPTWLNGTNFPTLATLDLRSNLVESVPIEFTTITSLNNGGGLNIYYNRIAVTDPAISLFLEAKNPNWLGYQFVAPTNFRVLEYQATGTVVAWDSQLLYAGSELSCGLTQGGPYTDVYTIPLQVWAFSIQYTLPVIANGQARYCVVRFTGEQTTVPLGGTYSQELQVNALPFNIEIPIEVIPSAYEVDLPDPLAPENISDTCVDGVLTDSGRSVSFGGNGRSVSFGGNGRSVSFGGNGEATTLKASTAGSSFDTVLTVWRVPNDTEFAETNPDLEYLGCNDNSDNEEPGAIDGLERPPGSPSYSSYIEVPFDRNFDIYFIVYSNNDESGTLIFTIDADLVTNLVSISLPEAEALSAIYSALDGNNWTNHSGWFENDDVCSWFGITCSMTGQSVELTAQAVMTVTGLSLPDNNLRGRLPAQIGNLTSLQSLDLSNNFVRGAIPTTASNLAALTSLNLDYNALYNSDVSLTTFLDSKNPGWQNTQTVAPTDILVGSPTADGYNLNFTPIPFSSGLGFYEAGCSLVAGGPYIVNNRTIDKTIGNLVVDRLFPGTAYFCNLRTYSHLDNGHDVFSDTSPEFTAITGLPDGVTGSDGQYVFGEGTVFPFIFQGNTSIGDEIQDLPEPSCSTGRSVSYGGNGRSVSFGGNGRSVSYGGNGDVEIIVDTTDTDYSHTISIWTVPPDGDFATDGTEIACTTADNSALLSITIDPNLNYVILIAGNYYEGGSLTAVITVKESDTLADSDNDGVNDALDVCPNTPAGSPVDGNGCALSQLDSDSDGVNDALDLCPDTPAGSSVNGNGCALSQLDSDSDGVNDTLDLCPDTPAGSSVNASGCAPSQLDSDGDGVNDTLDLCPNTSAGSSVNANGCALSQLDSDNDGVNDALDLCPNTSAGSSVNANGCALSQLDSDNDGVNDALDLCPNTPAGSSVNANGCALSQLDSDNDGVNDALDLCPNTPAGSSVNANGCALSQLDSDNDGVNDALDLCPDTSAGSSVNANGCALSQLDSDSDSVNDALDLCPNTSAGSSVNANGCALSQLDSDSDGVNDALDLCPNTSAGSSVNANGCALSQLDSDSDGVNDALDVCPNTPVGTQVDSNGCPILITNSAIIIRLSSPKNGNLTFTFNNQEFQLNANQRLPERSMREFSNITPGDYVMSINVPQNNLYLKEVSCSNALGTTVIFTGQPETPKYITVTYTQLASQTTTCTFVVEQTDR
jgi:subtilisin family serine protease/Leucine-rich repeat (LRR) protein